MPAKQTINTVTVDSLDQVIEHMRPLYHADETEVLQGLLSSLDAHKPLTQKIHLKASEFVHNLRGNRRRFGGLDTFLQKYGLDTEEGIALMCLAEALLRIPDAHTADKFIRDKMNSVEWNKHLGDGGDIFVNASTWALMLTGKVIGDVEEKKNKFSPANIMGGMVSKLGEPVVRRAMLHAMKILGRQFVMGRDMEEALDRAKTEEKLGYRYSYDMLGEGARTMADATRYLETYRSAIISMGESFKDEVSPIISAGISVKLSALYPRYEHSQKAICVPALVKSLKGLALLAAKYNIGLTVDAEEADRLELSLEIIKQVYLNEKLAKTGWAGFGLALQAYQKRAFVVVDWLAELVETGTKIYNNKRPLMVRLVKGAYWDSEIKHAQELGLSNYPVFTRKHATDVSFLACAKKLMDRRDVFYPQFATHNAHSLASIIEMAGETKTGFEFQRLHGMGEPLYHQIVGFANENNKYPVRIYAPVGSHEDLLPYLVRRLLENGANSSFVNRLQDDSVLVDDIVRDPIEYIEKAKCLPHPKIPLPVNIYGESRNNSKGLELNDEQDLEPILADIKSYGEKMTYIAAPMISGEIRHTSPANAVNVTDPADTSKIIGKVTLASKDDMLDALSVTHEFFPEWRDTSVENRANCLLKTADLLEENLNEFMALLVHEAGKTLPDALSETREAIDFCRYYAAEAKRTMAESVIMAGPTGEHNQVTLHGRGVYLCISPWNFPLAIFLGQVSAALVAGNCVIAKPAGQTPLIAAKVIELFYTAGVPKNALAFIPASGRLVGETLVTDARVAGVVMTGSTETAWTINKTLAARKSAIVPLIAETGGQNAMIVDSSALPEQVVDDVVTSAFGAAGQRCSALRVLFLQEDIADKTIEMLKGAMKELVIGNPAQYSTDIGPVIDDASKDSLMAHVKDMESRAKLICRAEVSENLMAKGSFFAPVAFEIDSFDMLEAENFGAILHVIRYKGKNLDKVIKSINDSGFGLTLGVHTRVEHVMRKIANDANVGNCYINRSMIGAVVGVQPFGGQGLSGTGAKAGGTHYLTRFVTEKTLTIDTTASGGNTTLVSLSEYD